MAGVLAKDRLLLEKGLVPKESGHGNIVPSVLKCHLRMIRELES